ncbi:hypothetical protein [Glycomyces salinus]|uniref:hypothetical protein n=1 Tax=Glycomyces salinus TaxID=980294 RepID=UPI0018EA9922|nr:hypothetical protein [Glycomyces salinus]
MSSDPSAPTGVGEQEAGRIDGDHDRRRRRVLWTVAITVASIVAAGMAWYSVREHPAQVVVKEFFAALRDKDAEAALELISPDGLDNAPRSEFQAPEALGGGWELTGTERTHSDEATIDVTAEFSTLDGMFEYEYTVVRNQSSGDWELQDPFVAVNTSGVPDALDYLQVNDVIAPRDARDHFWLFPGSYRFYQDVPGILDLEWPGIEDRTEPRTAYLFNAYSSTEPYKFDGAFAGPDGNAAVQQLVDERIAACLEAMQPDPSGCPFGIPDGTPVYLDEGPVEHFDEAEWSLAGPTPLVEIMVLSPWAENGFALVPVNPEDTLTAVMYGDGVDFETTCEFDFSIWSLSLVPEDGTVAFAFDESSGMEKVPYTTCIGFEP